MRLPARPFRVLSRLAQGLVTLWILAIASLTGIPVALSLAVAIIVGLVIPRGATLAGAVYRLTWIAVALGIFLALGIVSRTGAVPALVAFAGTGALLVVARRDRLELSVQPFRY